MASRHCSTCAVTSEGLPGAGLGPQSLSSRNVCRLHHHGAVNLIERCEKAGLVERRKDENDKRYVRVFLLPKGEALLQKLALLHKDQLLNMDAEFAVPDMTKFTRTE
jgi:hypothetical protein